jgi:hypothetical protein
LGKTEEEEKGRIDFLSGEWLRRAKEKEKEKQKQKQKQKQKDRRREEAEDQI